MGKSQLKTELDQMTNGATKEKGQYYRLSSLGGLTGPQYGSDESRLGISDLNKSYNS